jgi:hypothetical protein
MTECLAPCEENCLYGDYIFGNNPIEYDGSKCGCKQCPNFELCRRWMPPEYFDSCNGRCSNCDLSFRKNLVFSEKEQCPICLETKHRMVGHPAECGHKICKACFVEQWWPVPEYPSPSEFGLEGDDEDVWAKDFSDEYDAYLFALNKADFDLEQKKAERGDEQACPVCRAHLRDAPNNSWDGDMLTISF